MNKGDKNQEIRSISPNTARILSRIQDEKRLLSDNEDVTGDFIAISVN